MDDVQKTIIKPQNIPARTYRVENSDIIKHTLISLIYVATSKTSQDYAWSSIKILLEDLKENYVFLKYIQIGDIENLENTIDDIIVHTDFNQVNQLELSESIQNLIDLLEKKLGKKAGYFFIREFRDILGEKYNQILKDIGVDLRLIELQKELKGINGSKFKIKDDTTTNIGFIEKKE